MAAWHVASGVARDCTTSDHSRLIGAAPCQPVVADQQTVIEGAEYEYAVQPRATDDAGGRAGVNGCQWPVKAVGAVADVPVRGIARYEMDRPVRDGNVELAKLGDDGGISRGPRLAVFAGEQRGFITHDDEALPRPHHGVQVLTGA